MDYKVVWSPEAVDDVDSIATYIARDSEFYAAAVVDKILDATRKLALFPEAGRVVPELGDDSIREQFIYSYRLIYRIKGNRVTIAAVIHGKQQFSPFAYRVKNI